MCLGTFLLGFLLYMTLLPQLGWLFHNREVFRYYIFKYFVRPFLYICFQDTYNMNASAFNIVSEFSSTVLISFYFLFLYSVPPFRLPAHSSILLPHWLLPLIPSSVSLNHCAFYPACPLYHLALHWTFLGVFQYISCIFLVCASILFPRFWILFTVITLSSFSGRLSVST